MEQGGQRSHYCHYKIRKGRKNVRILQWLRPVQKVTRTLDMLSPYEFVLQQHELASIKGGEDLSSFLRAFGKPYDYDIYRNLSGTDYQDEMFGRTAWGQTHNLSINGGTDHTKFNISLTHLNEKGVMLESALKELISHSN